MTNTFFYFICSFVLCLTACTEKKQAPAPVSYGYDSPVTCIEAQAEQKIPIQIEKIIIVEQGQNLASISRKFKVSKDKIIQENGLKSPYFIYPGQNLKIPYSSSQSGHDSEEFADSHHETVVEQKEMKTSESWTKEEKEVLIKSKNSESLEPDSNLLPLPIPIRRKLSVVEREKSLESQFQNLEKENSELLQSSKKNKTEKSKKDISQNLEDKKSSQQEYSEKIENEEKKESLSSKELKSDVKLMNSETKSSGLSESLALNSSTSLQEKNSSSSVVKFKWPVQGKVVSSFNQEEGKIKNDGINISAPKGSLITATAEGVVRYVGNEIEGFGNLILIKHASGWMSSYGHCQKILVKRGQRVKQGTPIALVGNTGSVHKPELHFELRKESTKLDPMLYLD